MYTGKQPYREKIVNLRSYAGTGRFHVPDSLKLLEDRGYRRSERHRCGAPRLWIPREECLFRRIIEEAPAPGLVAPEHARGSRRPPCGWLIPQNNTPERTRSLF